MLNQHKKKSDRSTKVKSKALPHIFLNLMLLALLCFSSEVFAQEKRVLTLYGKVDPRLYVWVVSTYRSQDPSKMRENYEECTKANWNTGKRGRTLTYETATISTGKDTKDTYEVTIPIDYTEDNKCGWEYVGTIITIQRDKKDNLYNDIRILDEQQKVNHTEGKFDGGSKGINGAHKTTKNHFQLSSGSQIQCFTTWYEGDDTVIDRADFTCQPIGKDDINGVDTITSARLNIDIVVNENKCQKYVGKAFHTKAYDDYFRDYKKLTTRI